MNFLPQRITDLLDGDERVVWYGMPARLSWPVLAFQRAAVPMCVLVGAWMFREQLPIPSGLAGSLIVVIAIFGFISLVLGPLSKQFLANMAEGSIVGILKRMDVDALKRSRPEDRRTLYVITNRRAIILPPLWFGVDRPRSFFPDDLLHARVFTGWLGVGDVVFTSIGRWSRSRGDSGSSHSVEHVGFMRVTNSDAREIAETINRVLLRRYLGDPTTTRDRAATGDEIVVSRNSIGSWTVMPRSRTVEQPTEQRLEIVPTPGSRLMAVAYLVLLAIVMTLLFAGAESAPIRQLLDESPETIAKPLRIGFNLVATSIAIVFVGGAVVQAFERRAWFDNGLSKYQPSGLLPSKRNLDHVAAVQLVDVRTGVGSWERQRFEINMVEGDRSRRVHICQISAEQDKQSGRYDAAEAEAIARRIAAFLNVPLLR